MASAIRSTRRHVPSEAQVKKAVCDWLDAKRLRYHRLNAGAMVAEVIDSSRRLLSAAEADD